MANPIKDSLVLTVGISTFIIGATFVVNGAKDSIKELKLMGVATGSLLMFMGIRILHGSIFNRVTRRSSHRRGY